MYRRSNFCPLILLLNLTPFLSPETPSQRHFELNEGFFGHVTEVLDIGEIEEAEKLIGVLFKLSGLQIPHRNGFYLIHFILSHPID
jgi:hypothetical protein